MILMSDVFCLIFINCLCVRYVFVVEYFCSISFFLFSSSVSFVVKRFFVNSSSSRSIHFFCFLLVAFNLFLLDKLAVWILIFLFLVVCVLFCVLFGQFLLIVVANVSVDCKVAPTGQNCVLNFYFRKAIFWLCW